jgi:hypothetical protein
VVKPRAYSLIRNCVGILLASTLNQSCRDNDTSLYVEGVLARVPPSCETKADHSSPQFLRGHLDLLFRRSYTATLLIGNQMATRGDKEQLRSETMGIELRSAEVRVTGADPSDSIEEFSAPIGGFVGPNDSDAPGYGSAAVTLIPSTVTERLAPELAQTGGTRVLVAHVRVLGTTLGGIDVTSAELSFPIDVNYGGSIYYPSKAMDGGKCVNTAEAPAESFCSFGQDTGIDCRNCAETYAKCKDPKAP